jgi:hypothetical protein
VIWKDLKRHAADRHMFLQPRSPDDVRANYGLRQRLRVALFVILRRRRRIQCMSRSESRVGFFAGAQNDRPEITFPRSL